MFTKDELKENTSFEEIALNFKGDSIPVITIRLRLFNRNRYEKRINRCQSPAVTSSWRTGCDMSIICSS